MKCDGRGFISSSMASIAMVFINNLEVLGNLNPATIEEFMMIGNIVESHSGEQFVPQEMRWTTG